ncbi:hypothetical protein NKW44_09260 [Acetobacter lovaniensis]|uniref:hypothetical protein n=1 Tax=Acetobacter lovaniensis TaxID=104100 RepID=UPI0020A14C05|nr:hypothetical protein [Acetobacter lovaniensis]MCP1239882.1 hypothetical protein [Acetobacter lovaniensis]
MTDPRVEAAIDAVIKARGWRDSRWGDGAIGGFDYSTEEKKRHVIRDHEAEAREGKTVILFETGDYEEYEREYRRACIRREILAALAAADAAAWRPIASAPKDGSYVDLWVINSDGEGQRITDAYFGPIPHTCGEYGQFCDSCPEEGNFWVDGIFGHEINGEITQWQPLPNPPNATPQRTPDTITIPEVRNDRPIPVKGESHS